MERRETKFASAMAIKRSSRAANRLRRTDISGYGLTPAASTSEAAQNYLRPSTLCIGGMKTRAYLHDFPDPLFLTASDDERYPNSNGWPEWFSRGWTLQEMIAPSDVQFFNKDWKSIGDKRTLALTLAGITAEVPEHVLMHGLRGNRPCVAQIMSWAAHRTTTRVEDRAYSLMGLLDVNMPMLYGEGKKAFHRLQLEIIRSSNDQSVFAWGCNVRTGNILADDPSFFEYCDAMELIYHEEFIQFLK